MQMAGRALGWLLLVGLLTCRSDPDATFRAEVGDLQARTVPPDGRLLAESPIARDAWSVEATWEVETAMSWDDYGAARPRLRRGAAAGRAEDGGYRGEATWTPRDEVHAHEHRQRVFRTWVDRRMPHPRRARW